MSVAPAAVAERRMTVEEFLNTSQDGVWEFVDGAAVEKQMGNESNQAALRLAVRLIQRFGEATVVTECWLRCFREDPDRVRRPDVAYFDLSLLPDGTVPDISRIAPTLAVEALSPRNTAQEIDQKIDEYHAAGIPLVWVLNPKARTLRVHPIGGPARTYREDETFAGEPLLPGLTFKVAELFAARRGPTGG